MNTLVSDSIPQNQKRVYKALTSAPPPYYISFGGGVQSTALLVLAIQGRLAKPYAQSGDPIFVFSNVGDDSENPSTLEYIENYHKPLCEQYGLDFIEVQKTFKGEKETLVEHIYRTKRSVPIPARMSNGAPGNRSCTTSFKIRIVDNYIKSTGTYAAVVGLGISLDEYHRARNEHWHDVQSQTAKKKVKLGFWKRRYHPLVHMRVKRVECRQIIQDFGLPIPPKSSCYFCPFKKRGEWLELKRREPELFEKAVDIEKHINEKRGAMDKDRVYLHASTIPLEQAVGAQLTLFSDEEMDMCESGYCHT